MSLPARTPENTRRVSGRTGLLAVGWTVLCLVPGFLVAQILHAGLMTVVWAVGLALLLARRRGQACAESAREDAAAELARRRRMFQTGPVITFTWRNEEDWPVDSVSDNITDLLGYRPEDLESGRVAYSRLVHPEDLTRVVQEMVCFCQQEQEFFSHTPYRLVARDGSVLWVQDHTSTYRDASGRITHYVGYLIDITASRALATEMANHRDRLELVIDGADLGTWDWNIATGEVCFNERWGGMLGMGPDEVLADLSTWEKVVHPEDMPEIQRVLTRHLEGEIPEYKTEHRLRHRDGHWVWVLDAGRVYERDREGRPLKAAGIHLDITRTKEAERERKRAMCEAEQANRKLSGALAEVHTLRGIIGLCPDCALIYFPDAGNDSPESGTPA